MRVFGRLSLNLWGSHHISSAKYLTTYLSHLKLTISLPDLTDEETEPEHFKSHASVHTANK